MKNQLTLIHLFINFNTCIQALYAIVYILSFFIYNLVFIKFTHDRNFFEIR